MDLIEDLAYPLPVTIIAELLGVPIEDRDLFQVDKILSSTPAERYRTDDEHGTSKNIAQVINEMQSYFSNIVEERTKNPREDLITNLVKAGRMDVICTRTKSLLFVRFYFLLDT